MCRVPYVLLFFAAVVRAATVCVPGVYASVWKGYYVEMNRYIRVEVLKKLEAMQNDPNANYVNTLQPLETDLYNQLAREMLKEENLDVFDVDIVYSGSFGQDTVDLQLVPDIQGLIDSLDPILRDAYTYDGRLVAFPLYKNQGILVYRKDLLRKYKFDENEPMQANFTWKRLETIARTIMEGEQKANPKFIGYAWQGLAYEGLTCNLMEWLASDGFVREIVNGDKVTLNDENNTRIAIEALERARRWLLDGGISSRDTLNWKEKTSNKEFTDGNSAFLRTWDSMYQKIRNEAAKEFEVDATYLPAGKAARAATIGGWGVALANMTMPGNACRAKNAVQALRWIVNKTAGREYFNYGFNPVYKKAFTDELCINATRDHIVCSLDRLVKGPARLVARPKPSAKYKYKDVSTVIHDFVNRYLKTSPPAFDAAMDISNTTVMLKRLSCVLNRTLRVDTPTITGESCTADSTAVQTDDERWKKFAELFPGDANCANDFNYISKPVRYVCWFFCGFVWLLCVLCAMWIGLNTSHIVVNRSQPIFLYMVLLGVALNISTIVPLAMDEDLMCRNPDSPRQCQDRLDAACRAIPFVYGYGFFITFGSLLVKLWRVEKIFNNKELKRIQITVSQLVGWVGCLVALLTILNVVWMTTTSLVWYRVRLNTEDDSGASGVGLQARDSFCNSDLNFCDKYQRRYTLKSVGYCGGPRKKCAEPGTHSIDTSLPFMIIYLALEFFLLAYSTYIGYKARNISTSFAEGRYIAISIMNQFQLIMVGVAAFGFVSKAYVPDTVMLVFSCILFFGNLSTLVLLFVPKFIAMRRISIKKQSKDSEMLNPVRSLLSPSVHRRV